MAETMHFELVSPERLLMDEQVAQVVVPGAEGDFGVLPGHAPVMSTIRPGVVAISESEGSEPKRLFVKGGFAEAGPEGLVILAEDAIDPSAVDLVDLDKKMADTREDLSMAKTDFDRNRLEGDLEWMQVLRDIIT